MKLLSMFLVIAVICISTTPTHAETRKLKTSNVTPENARVYFVNLKDGQEVPTKFKVKMGLDGMKLRNASDDIEDKTTGHHHILVDKKFIPAGEAIPADEMHIHLGKSQDEVELNLKPGKHTLTLQLADGAHRSYGEKLSATINITVK